MDLLRSSSLKTTPLLYVYPREYVSPIIPLRCGNNLLGLSGGSVIPPLATNWVYRLVSGN